MDKLYGKILCPVDFSPFSATALKRAASLSQVFDAKLVLAHVITNPWADQYKIDDNVSVMPKEVGKVVEKKIKEFAEAHIPGLPYEIWVTIHEHTYKGLIEYASLVEYASVEKVDLIVLSTHGYSGSTKLFLGSVAESLVRQAPCSVLVVRESGLSQEQ